MEKQFIINQKNSKILSSLDDLELSSLIRLILSYVEGKKIKIVNPRIEALFLVFKLEIDNQQKELLSQQKKRSVSAKKGATKRIEKKKQIEIYKKEILPHFVPVPVSKKQKIEVPSFQDVYLYVCTIPEYKSKAESIRFSLKAKYDAWVENKWRDGYNKPISNWKTKIRGILPYLKQTNNANTTVENKQRIDEENRISYLAKVFGEELELDNSSNSMQGHTDTEDTDFTDVSLF